MPPTDTSATGHPATAAPATAGRFADRLKYLAALEQKILWLSVWMIHHANHIRPKRDGLKVGGHQASSASLTTLMTALYFDVLRPADRVAVKPHASPNYHAIQYLFGRQTRAKLEQFRAFGGAQSYPSRTKDSDDVDFSTGSVGLGVAMTSFAALVQDYLRARGQGADAAPGRMVALAGDAEFDEGNIFEALLEGWKHDLTNTWWVVDYNRQSLDAVITDRFSPRLDHIFQTMNWRVVNLKYGKRLQQAFERRGGDALRDWIDACPNALYSVLAHQGGSWRQHLVKDLGETSGIRELLDEVDDEGLHRLMTNLGGHDLEAILEAFHAIDDDQPTCFIAYTIKGHRLPFAGHKDNHAGLMTPAQLDVFKAQMNIRDGEEWDPFAGLDVPTPELQAFLDAVPFNTSGSRRQEASRIPIPARLNVTASERSSTQEGLGRLLSDLARQHPEVADRVVTTSPDVTISTNLGPWINRRGVFGRDQTEAFHEHGVASPQRWSVSPQGQHIELGIAENNLFILLAALGLAGPLFGERLLPIGTVYDPFICRGLDALNYACYQDARFILAATPSGVTLAPEGGAHQSIFTPLIGLGQPGLTMFEPAHVDELAEILRWSLEHIQADDGGAVYLRLSTKPLAQPQRSLSDDIRQQIIDGGYWLIPPGRDAELAIVCMGAVVPEALAAQERLSEDLAGVGVLVITSVDRLHHGWLGAAGRDVSTVRPASHVERLLDPIAPDSGLITVLDGHPATLAWLGSVKRHRVIPLGVTNFGQCGDIPDLYRHYGLDAEAILDAAAQLCVQRAGATP